MRAAPITTVAVLSLMAAACTPVNTNPDKVSVDQCLRKEFFDSCMKGLPAGPQATQYNDWGEVVEQCQQASYFQAKRLAEHIPPQCRVEFPKAPYLGDKK